MRRRSCCTICQNCHHDWNVALKGLSGSVVRQTSAAQKASIIHPNRNCHRKTNRRPNRETPADPIPKLKHIIGVDTETKTSVVLVEIATKCWEYSAQSWRSAETGQGDYCSLRDEGFRQSGKASFQVKLLSVSTISVPSTLSKVHTQAVA